MAYADSTTVKAPWWFTWLVLPLGSLLMLALFVLIIFRSFFLVFVDNYELAYVYDAMTGKITVAEHPGWVYVNPFTQNVNTIDTRPMQVCNNANTRVLNCKLVKFNVRGLELFLSWHGREYGNMSEILKSYAFEETNKQYPFLDIIRELKPSDAIANNSTATKGLPMLTPQTENNPESDLPDRMK